MFKLLFRQDLVFLTGFFTAAKSTSRREAWIKRHPPVDKKRGAGDIIGCIRDKPRDCLGYVLRLTDALVRH